MSRKTRCQSKLSPRNSIPRRSRCRSPSPSKYYSSCSPEIRIDYKPRFCYSKSKCEPNYKSNPCRANLSTKVNLDITPRIKYKSTICSYNYDSENENDNSDDDNNNDNDENKNNNSDDENNNSDDEYKTPTPAIANLVDTVLNNRKILLAKTKKELEKIYTTINGGGPYRESFTRNITSALRSIEDQLFYFENPFFFTRNVEMKENETVNGFKLFNVSNTTDLMDYEHFKEFCAILKSKLFSASAYAEKDFKEKVKKCGNINWHTADENGVEFPKMDEEYPFASNFTFERNLNLLWRLPYPREMMIKVLTSNPTGAKINCGESKINARQLVDSNFHSVKCVRYVNAICVWVERKLNEIGCTKDELIHLLKFKFSDCWIIIMKYFCFPCF